MPLCLHLLDHLHHTDVNCLSTPILNVKSAIHHDYLYHLMAASAIMLKLFTDNIWSIPSVRYVNRMPMHRHIS